MHLGVHIWVRFYFAAFYHSAFITNVMPVSSPVQTSDDRITTKRGRHNGCILDTTLLLRVDVLKYLVEIYKYGIFYQSTTSS